MTALVVAALVVFGAIVTVHRAHRAHMLGMMAPGPGAYVLFAAGVFVLALGDPSLFLSLLPDSGMSPDPVTVPSIPWLTIGTVAGISLVVLLTVSLTGLVAVKGWGNHVAPRLDRRRSARIQAAIEARAEAALVAAAHRAAWEDVYQLERDAGLRADPRAVSHSDRGPG